MAQLLDFDNGIRDFSITITYNDYTFKSLLRIRYVILIF